MNHNWCERNLADRDHRLHQLWGEVGWKIRQRGRDRTCFDNGPTFFEDALQGRPCEINWYSGNDGNLGTRYGGPSQGWVQPHFTKAAPALLGFDESIDWYCGSHGGQGQHAVACVGANVNILSLYGDAIPYNICRNFEWQICAAKGLLPGQGGKQIRFAYAPKWLEPAGGPHPFGSCNSYAPAGCGEGEGGYGSSDIFFLESCVYSMACLNRDEFWALDAEQDFECVLDVDGYRKLQHFVLSV